MQFHSRPDVIERTPPPRRRLPLAFALREVAPRAAGRLPGVLSRGPATAVDGMPAAYLTFDDGPSHASTGLLLDELARHMALATFFVLAGRASRAPGLVRAMSDAGHTIGSHGWGHPDPWSAPGALDDMRRGTSWLEDTLGRHVDLVRPPYGRLTPASWRWARAGGRTVVLWDCMPGDFTPVNARTIAARLHRSACPGSIIVLHDDGRPRRAADIVRAAMPAWHGLGWTFPTL